MVTLSVIDMTSEPSASVIGNARFGRFQFEVTALCALIAGIDGFDTQVIAYVAPSVVNE
jgi:AAHS family 4-hydroxybenzoate transporter-like MFS transporter